MAETKPPCDLFFDYTFGGSASQTTTMTVLGQSLDSSGVTPDEQICVNVTAAELNTLLTVGAQSSPGVGYPSVVLNWTPVGAKLNAVYDTFLDIDLESSGTDFTDDQANSVPTLQKVFSTREFTFGENLLASIPLEAVKSVDYSGAISVANADAEAVTQKLADVTVEGVGAGSLFGKEITAGTEADIESQKQRAVRSLYLQALAADRYTQSSTPQGASQGFTFQVNDSLTVYLDLSLTKTRKFIPFDGETQVGGPSATAGVKRFAIDGSDVVIGDAEPADDEYSSSALHHMVAWKLVVTA